MSLCILRFPLSCLTFFSDGRHQPRRIIRSQSLGCERSFSSAEKCICGPRTRRFTSLITDTQMPRLRNISKTTSGLGRVVQFRNLNKTTCRIVGRSSDTDGSVLTGDGSELQNTLRLVECAMLAATAGLAYFLSNLFRLEAYLGCFFPLPVVLSSMRWGASAGRKTMIGTAMLLLVLSGPLKAASYLLMHGFVGLGMGALWRWHSNFLLSIAICTVIRSLGAMGFVLLSSWLLRENLLALITINAHASFSYILAAVGVNIIPSMMAIYVVFAILLLINCGSFVFLLHVLYAIFLKRLGIRTTISVPGWIERAL